MAKKQFSSDGSKKSSVNWGTVVGAKVDRPRESQRLSGLKVKGHHTKKGKERRRKSTPTFEKKSSSAGASLAPIIVGSFCLLVLLLGGGYWFLQSSTDRIFSVPSTPNLNTASSSKINDHRSLEVKVSTVYDIAPPRVAENFALSDSLEERLKWARRPEIIRTRLHRYDPQAIDVPASIINSIGTSIDPESKYYLYVAIFPDGARRMIAVMGTDEGPRVDFDAYACLHSHPWEDIVGGKVTSARARIIIEPTNYYVRKYQDRERWVSYRISTEIDEGVLYGYCERDSELHQQLANVTRTSRGYSILDLKLSPADTNNKQVLITKLHSDDWIEDEVAPATPRDSKKD